MKSRWIILVLVIVALVGCHGRLREALRRHKAPPVAGVKLSPEQVVSQLKVRQGQLTSLAAKGRVTLVSPEQNATGTAILKGKLPETLRVDLRDPLGRSVLSFYTDGRQVEILFPRENKLLTGPATPANLSSFIPAGVKLPQALRLMVGDLPLSQGKPTRMNQESDRYVLEWQAPDGSLQERLWVQAGAVQPVKDEWYGAGGRLIFSAELGEYGKVAIDRPGQVKLVTTSPRVELLLTYKDFTPNPTLTPTDLAVPKPLGVVVQHLQP
jgi:outer membrane biogenesis lipoprotein LolB